MSDIQTTLAAFEDEVVKLIVYLHGDAEREVETYRMTTDQYDALVEFTSYQYERLMKLKEEAQLVEQ